MNVWQEVLVHAPNDFFGWLAKLPPGLQWRAILLVALIQTQVPDRIVAPLAEAARQGRRLELAFFAVHPEIQFRIALTPERLRQHYSARSMTREAAGQSKRVNSLLLALQKSRLTPMEIKSPKPSRSVGIDVRYGFEVADGDGRSLFWMCTNAAGDLAAIDSRVYRLSGPVSGWFLSEGRRLLFAQG